MQGTYTVTIEVPYGTVMTNVTGGTAGTPTTGKNNTLAVAFSVDQKLLPNAGNSIYVNMSVLASSQVCSFPERLRSTTCLLIRHCVFDRLRDGMSHSGYVDSTGQVLSCIALELVIICAV